MIKRPTISIYLVSMNMLLLGMLFPIFSFLFMREMVSLRDIQLERNIQTIRQALATRSSSLVRSTALSAKEAIAGFDFAFLQNLLLEVTQDDTDLRACMVLDLNRTVIAHSDDSLLGSTLAPEAIDQPSSPSQFAETLPQAESEVQFFWPPPLVRASDQWILKTIFPIYIGDKRWGTIRCDYSLATIDQAIAQARAEWRGQVRQLKRYFFFLLATFLGLGFIIAIALTRSLVRSTQVLHSGVRQVAGGELDHEIKLPGGIVCAEFAGLVSSFNTMTAKLRLSHRQLDDYSKSLEEKVEERTRALHEAQGLMVKQAHEAGLAEMAVGILHNIGNAITPAQIGTITLGQHLAESPLRTRLGLSLQPLQEFLAGRRQLRADEKTRFCKILAHLPAGINEEFDFAVKALREISAKHHHIENIIKLQMRYARLLDNPGRVEINRLAQDAVNLLADALDKRQIEVELQLAETPTVRAEETKLLQVMVNLIKNGYEAMDDGPGQTRKLTISTDVEAGPPPAALFSVQDTGAGFTKEAKNRLFAFGYSTKERGSGFGLHSSANYVIANHGSIEAESPGPGLGATFTVRLPAE